MAQLLWGATGLLISTGMWAWVLRRYDRLEPEPIKVLLKVGLLGGLMSVIPAIIGNTFADHFLGLGGFVRDLSRNITLPLALGSAVFIGINEETWFRLFLVGLVYFLLRPALHKHQNLAVIAAALFSAVVFGVGHGRDLEETRSGPVD